MASFQSGAKTPAERGPKVQTGKDFLAKNKDQCSPADYREAGLEWVNKILGLPLTDSGADTLCNALVEYLDRYKTDKISKSGKPLADIGGYSPTMSARAFGAIYGNRDIGDIIYTVSNWFDTTVRLSRLQALLKADKGTTPKRKGSKA